jgi:hypothetical protein
MVSFRFYLKTLDIFGVRSVNENLAKKGAKRKKCQNKWPLFFFATSSTVQKRTIQENYPSIHRSKRAFCQGLNKLDKQSKDIMINAEKKCCQIKSGCILFLPESAL